jgi:hypothetical protein
MLRVCKSVHLKHISFLEHPATKTHSPDYKFLVVTVYNLVPIAMEKLGIQVLAEKSRVE